MNTSYTFAATQEADENGAVGAAVAALPLSFRPAATGENAQVAAIAGAAGWTSEAIRAVDAGARGVVVIAPHAEDTSALSRAAASVGAAVVLDHRWASNPGLVGAEDAVRSVAGRTAMLDTVATSAAGGDPEQLLAEHFAAVVRLTGPLESVHVLHRGPHGYTVSARLANAAPATLQGVLSDGRAAGVDFRLYTNDGGVSISVPEPSAAWPAEVRATAGQGEVLLPTLYETAHRGSWRRLKGHLDAGTLPADLAGFARLTAQLAQLG